MKTFGLIVGCIGFLLIAGAWASMFLGAWKASRTKPEFGGAIFLGAVLVVAGGSILASVGP